MKMNPIESYREAGTKAGKASRQHDAGLCRHWAQWKRAALRLESEPYRQEASAAFDQAYRDEAMPK